MPKSIAGVMQEYKDRALHSGGSGKIVTNRKQAIAIAIHEQKARGPAPKRALHPALAERSQMVKEAHAHLRQAIPGFHKLPFQKQAMATQEHVRQRKKNGY